MLLKLNMLLFKQVNKYRFSLTTLFQPIPKNLQAEKTSFLSTIFQQTKKSPTYPLLKELFSYLETTTLLRQQFPLLSNNEIFLENSMTIHTILLKNRLKTETQIITTQQLQIFDYNCQTYFYPSYSAFLHTDLPVKHYKSHYSQSYQKRFELFDQVMTEQQAQFSTYKIQDIKLRLNQVFSKLIYENKLAKIDPQASKFTKYYLAHRKYLNILSFEDLINYKVKWGFEEDTKLLQTFE